MADMSVGSWYQATKRDTAGVSTGKVSDEPLTYTMSQVTVGVGSGTLLAAAAASTITRTVTIFVRSNAAADTNGLAITINDTGAAVVATHFGIPPGGSVTLTTLDALTAIRNGASDVTAYLLVGTK